MKARPVSGHIHLRPHDRRGIAKLIIGYPGRLNAPTLQALRAFADGSPGQRAERTPPYAYADSAEHRDGLAAFKERRPPHLSCPDPSEPI